MAGECPVDSFLSFTIFITATVKRFQAATDHSQNVSEHLRTTTGNLISNKRISFRKPRRTESLELQFGIRLFALIIDLILIKIIVFPILFWLTGTSIGWRTESIISIAGTNIIAPLIYWAYFAVLEGTIGATFGKLFVRLRIYDSNGSKLAITKAILRFPLKVISIASVLGVLMIDINKEKQGLHDLICGTIVRRK